MTNPKKNSVLAIQEKMLTEAISNPTALMARAAKDGPKSIKWFTERVRKQRAKEEGAAGHANSVPVIGHMYLFSYDPKTKEDLPYWDVHPLVIPIAYRKDGFIGINFHYLPPAWRARLLRQMIHNFTASPTHIQYLRVTYAQMKGIASMKAFRPCIKRYIYSHMRARWQRIPPTEWTNAVMLPLQKFVGQSDHYIWSRSIYSIR